MAAPYSVTSVNNYNANPPSDDGAETAANRVQWSTQKTKLTDPVKAAFDTSETATQTAFGKVPGGAGITSTAVDYTVTASDQGKLVKVSVAGTTITTPDATIVNAPFLFRVVNISGGDITLDGNSTQTVDGAATVTIPAGTGVAVDTDGTNWFTNGQNFNRTQVVPQGYLTLVSGTAIITSDQTAKTAVYYTPHVGDLIPIPNGTSFNVKQFAQLTLTLNGTNYVAGNLYDVFVALDPADNATVIIGSGPAWSTPTAGSGARGTGAGTTEVVKLHGLKVNTNAITLRNNATTYSIAAKCATKVGTIYVNATNGQLNCHVSVGQSRIWGVWNDYNQRDLVLQVTDPTASWTYNTATYRPSNNDATNCATPLAGEADSRYDIEFIQATNGGAATNPLIGIGWNSTSAISGRRGAGVSPSTGPSGQDIVARYIAPPAIGINVVTALESPSTAAAVTYIGANVSMLMLVKWRG